MIRFSHASPCRPFGTSLPPQSVFQSLQDISSPSTTQILFLYNLYIIFLYKIIFCLHGIILFIFKPISSPRLQSRFVIFHYTPVSCLSVIPFYCRPQAAHPPSTSSPHPRFGLAVRREAGKQRDLVLNLLRLCFHLKSCGLWTLSCDFVPHNYETLKWLSSLPALIQQSFWW